MAPVEAKTKVLCTMGRSSSSLEVLTQLLLEGMQGIRLCAAFGTPEEHAKTLENLKEAMRITERRCTVFVDLRGFVITTGKLKKQAVESEEQTSAWRVKAGDTIVFSTDFSIEGDSHVVGVNYPQLPKLLSPGQTIYANDGILSFTVKKCVRETVECTVDYDGKLRDHMQIFSPDMPLDFPLVTQQDLEHLKFALDNQDSVDFIAVNFRKVDDIIAFKKLPGMAHAKIPFIAKIGCFQSLENFDQILSEVDAIMVARGDLGLELPLEKVASAQKLLIRKCNIAGKPVITATQVMESMTHNPRPTRAEATDVANAVFDGTDCILLTDEVAVGKYPVNAVRMISRICAQAEQDLDYRVLYQRLWAHVIPPISVSESVASSAVKSASDVRATLIIGLSATGNTVRLISKFRPPTIILCVTDNPLTAQRVLLHRGAKSLLIESMTDETKIKKAIQYSKKRGFCQRGDAIVITSGVVPGVAGNTNVMKVHTVQ